MQGGLRRGGGGSGGVHVCGHDGRESFAGRGGLRHRDHVARDQAAVYEVLLDGGKWSTGLHHAKGHAKAFDVLGVIHAITLRGTSRQNESAFFVVTDCRQLDIRKFFTQNAVHAPDENS